MTGAVISATVAPMRPRALIGPGSGRRLLLLFAVQVGYAFHRGHASNSHVFAALYIPNMRANWVSWGVSVRCHWVCGHMSAS